MRGSGILMHISSLPSQYGIGTMGVEAYKFIDFLKRAKQKYWQILPIGPTSYGDSPYQSFSAYAGNPYFIDLEELVQEELITKADCEACDWGGNPGRVDYEKIHQSRFQILRKAFKNGYEKDRWGIDTFRYINGSWLEDYALYMAVKAKFDNVSWQNWDADIKKREPQAMQKYREELREEILFWCYIQHTFFKQWEKLKRYANENGIRIIGDIPIYVALDSADTWAHSEMFLLDDNKMPTHVAGCPPDGYAKFGQLWGNPIYDWKTIKEHHYDWWVDRVRYSSTIYDITRIDHFRGFDGYFTIEYGEETAVNGVWRKGPGIELFNEINNRLKNIHIIAEDLGFLTDSVHELRRQTGYPGMKVLQFAFDPKGESDYLPHCYDKNCVVYTGTHDNDTLPGWCASANKEEVAFAKKYLGVENKGSLVWEIIRCAYSSVAETSIVQMQDFLELGSDCRMNTPSTLGLNWQWRIEKDVLDMSLADKIADLVKLYSR